jgi:hypothetical protein
MGYDPSELPGSPRNAPEASMIIDQQDVGLATDAECSGLWALISHLDIPMPDAGFVARLRAELLRTGAPAAACG